MARGRSIRDLFVRIGFDADDAPLRKIDRGVNSLKGNLRTLRNVLLGTTGVLAGFGLALREAARFEQIEIAFEVLLGSAERANILLKDLLETARTTPFLIPEILKAGQQLVALGTPMENVVDELRMLGNVASGTNTELFLIVDAFSKARATGFLMGEVFRQFRRQGVPITSELEKITGKTGQALRKMGAAGEITFPLLLQAFKNMTGEGGKFFNLMERQSKTTLGILSNIKDSIIIAAIRIGEGLLPQVKKLEKVVFDFLEINKKIIAQKGKKLFMDIGRGIAFAVKVGRDLASTLLDLTQIFGGLENTIKLTTIALLAMFSISVLSGIGNLTIGVLSLATAFATVGNAAAIAQLKAFAFPVLVGTALVALGLIIEDIVGFFKGKDSLTGLIVSAFEENIPKAVRTANRDLQDFINTMKTFFDTATSGFRDIFSFFAKPGGFKDFTKTIKSFFGTAFSGFGTVGRFLTTPVNLPFGLSPATSPATTQGATSTTINRGSSVVTGDIIVNAPPGADAGEIGDTVKRVLKEEILAPAHKILRPSEVQ